MTNAHAIFQSLPRPSRAGAWTAEPPNGTPWRVGRSYDGHPGFLINLDMSGSSSPRRLANIAYVPPTHVEIVDDRGRSLPGELATLECRSDDALLAQYFFRLVDVLVVEDEAKVDNSTFEHRLDALIDLFRSIQRPPQRTVQGLWGELAVIAWAPDPKFAASAWHSSPRALHDFVVGDDRLEVKTASRGLREHSFRLEQVTMGSGTTLVASLLLEESEQGASVGELLALINNRVANREVERRLETIVAHSLGLEWPNRDRQRYMLDAAYNSMLLYAAEDIPRVLLPVPAAVHDVRFTADLSSTRPTLEIATGLRAVLASRTRA